LSLVKGAPEGAAKNFLDAALCQLYPGYLTVYRRYIRALQQKNALLRRSEANQTVSWQEKNALLDVLTKKWPGRARPSRAAAAPIWSCSARLQWQIMRICRMGRKSWSPLCGPV